jgi:hypothetical protein
LRWHWCTGERACGGDAGRDPHAAPDFGGHDPQPPGQHVTQPHSGRVAGSVVAVGRIGKFGEHAIRQSAVDPHLMFQPLGHLDPKGVAHQIR